MPTCWWTLTGITTTTLTHLLHSRNAMSHPKLAPSCSIYVQMVTGQQKHCRYCDIQRLRRPNQVHTALHLQIERHWPRFIMLTFAKFNAAKHVCMRLAAQASCGTEYDVRMSALRNLPETLFTLQPPFALQMLFTLQMLSALQTPFSFF